MLEPLKITGAALSPEIIFSQLLNRKYLWVKLKFQLRLPKIDLHFTKTEITSLFLEVLLLLYGVKDKNANGSFPLLEIKSEINQRLQLEQFPSQTRFLVIPKLYSLPPRLQNHRKTQTLNIGH